eukprot:235179-Rhodomonas_salina.2
MATPKATAALMQLLSPDPSALARSLDSSPCGGWGGRSKTFNERDALTHRCDGALSCDNADMHGGDSGWCQRAQCTLPLCASLEVPLPSSFSPLSCSPTWSSARMHTPIADAKLFSSGYSVSAIGVGCYRCPLSLL